MRAIFRGNHYSTDLPLAANSSILCGDVLVTTRQSTEYAVHGYDLTQGLRSYTVKISNMHHLSSMQSAKGLSASTSAPTAVTVIQCSCELI